MLTGQFAGYLADVQDAAHRPFRLLRACCPQGEPGTGEQAREAGSDALHRDRAHPRRELLGLWRAQDMAPAQA